MRLRVFLQMLHQTIHHILIQIIHLPMFLIIRIITRQELLGNKLTDLSLVVYTQ